MRAVLPLIALLLATSASAQNRADSPPVTVLPGPVFGGDGSSAVCRDRIQEVRRDSGKPALQRDASPQDPLFIAAVDKRVGGCSVLAMRNDTSDIRPLPEPGEHRLMPAK